MSSLEWARPRIGGTDRGFTLVELLVAIVLMGIIGTVVFTSVLAGQRAANTSRTVNDLNEEARLVLNRMSRELREAQRVTAVTNVNGPGFAATNDVKITFEVDFNGNGVIEPTAADPERITYQYDYAQQRLLLVAAGSTYPVLAANVASFTVDLTSRKYRYDGTPASGMVCATGTQGSLLDGTIHWWEIDSHASRADGNCNGVLDAELASIDSIWLQLKVLYGAKQQEYRTRVDLRNAS